MSEAAENNRLVEENERLRRRVAELEALAERLRRNFDTVGEAVISVDRAGRLLHELQVHQIELEMQNEELRRTQAALDAESARYQYLYDQAPVGYCTVTEQDLVIEANRCFATLLGVARDALIRQPISRFILKEDQDAYYFFRKQPFEVGKPQACELRMVSLDGTTFWAHLLGTIASDEGGTLPFHLVMSDITERKQAQQDVESLARFPEENPNPVLRAQHDGKILYANRGSRVLMTEWKCAVGVFLPSNLRDVIARSMARRESAEVNLVCNDREFSMSVSPIPGSDHVNIYGLDVTERKRAETALKASEALTRGILENAQDAYIRADRDGRILMVSPSAVGIYGYGSMAEMIGLPTVELYADREERLDILEKIKERGSVHDRVGKGRKKGGAVFWLSLNARFFRDEHGQVAGAECFVRDITERKQAEEILRASEERYQQLVNNTDTGYVVIDDKGIVLSANEPYQRLAGAERIEDVIGHSVTEWTAPDARESNARAVTRCAEHGFVDNFETVYQHADGTRVNVSIDAAVAQVFDGGVRIASLCRNITERRRAENRLRESEQRLRRFYESGLLGVIYWNTHGQITDANDKFLEMVGFTRADLEAGQIDWLGMTPPEYRHLDEDSLAELRATGRNKAVFEKEYIRKDGMRIPIAVAGAMLDDERVNGVAFVQDISDRKLAEAKRHKLEEQLRVAQRMEAIGHLAAGVAHDFNNLLSVILGSTEFAMARAREDEGLKSELVEVRKAGERAVILTRQLLAFGRKQILQPTVLNLNQIAEGVEKMMRRILGEDIDYLQVLAPDLGMVRADPGQIEQVLMNLVVNARDAMPDGGKLTIETRNVDLDEQYAARHVSVKPGHYVQCTVSDTGCGMDKETQARIFEPFFTTKEKGKGTGLGLSTVYGIVKQSGGNIWVYSEPGRGTTFKIYLPRDRSPATNVTASRLEAIKTPSKGTETILLVEDEEAMLGIAKRILRKAGYTVLAAGTAADALENCNAHQGKIDLMLTDVVMPRLGGRVLAERLAVSRPETKVLYMSGYADEAIAHHGTLDPGTHFIAKPFSAADLTKKVREVLDSEMVQPVEEPNQAPETNAKTGDQSLDDAPQAVPADVLASLWAAAVAARYDEIVDLIETVRKVDPLMAARLGEKAEVFDYEGLRRLLANRR